MSFDVVDAESAVSSQSADCSGVSISADQDATTCTRTARSLGGEASQFVTIRRDATAPQIACRRG